MFNDDWMRERGFLEEDVTTVADAIKDHADKPLITVKTEELVSHAIERMRKYKISQIPVVDIDGIVGSVDETALFECFVENKESLDRPIKEIMGKPYPIVQPNTRIEDVSKLFSRDNQAVLVDLGDKKYNILTKYDLIAAMK